MVPHFLGLVGQVVRVHPNAVSTHEPRPERQEIPLAAGGFQHVEGVDTQSIEDDRQFVHQGDIEVALSVFDDLRGFGHLQAVALWVPAVMISA